MVFLGNLYTIAVIFVFMKEVKNKKASPQMQKTSEGMNQ